MTPTERPTVQDTGIPRERLKNALQLNDVVIVVGAGVSAAIGSNPNTSSWKSLLRSGIEEVANRNSNGATLLEMRLDAAVSATELSGIADAIRDSLGVDYPRWIDFSCRDAPSGSELPDLIDALGFPILTTNYDTLLSEALQLPKVTWKAPDDMRKVLQGSLRAIGHLHGVRDEPESVILSSRDYSTILADPGARRIQDSAFNLKTFVFIGAGATTEDPNFGMMIEEFSKVYTNSDSVHFRLCRDSDLQKSSQISSVVDVPYGTSYEDLVPFIQHILAATRHSDDSRHRINSLTNIAQTIQATSLATREQNASLTPRLDRMIVEPVLLPVSHSKFSNISSLRKAEDQPKELDADDIIQEGKVLLVAGDSNSGITTALAWLTSRAAVKLSAHPLLIDRPLHVGKNPIKRPVAASRRDRNVTPESSRDILSLDNFALEDSKRFRNALSDLASIRPLMAIIGVPESDAPGVSAKLKELGFGDVQTVHLGRFGERETLALANLLDPDNGKEYAKQALSVAVEKHLPRTPFTLTLLLELLRTGIHPGEGDTETWLLGRYIDYLLEKDLFDEVRESALTVRNKRAVLEAIARMLVQNMSDEAPIEDLEICAERRVQQLGWDSSGRAIVSDFMARRVLAPRSSGRIGFLRSSYLELMAGEAAKRDPGFREYILDSPLQLAPIFSTYVAVSRNDEEALRLASEKLDNIPTAKPRGTAFGKLSKVPQQDSVPSGDVASEGAEGQAPGDDEVTGSLDGLSLLPPDSDPPSYLAQSFDTLPPAGQAALVVDLVSRVLRDSDEVENQELKSIIAGKLFLAWVEFVDRFEAELESLPINIPADDSEVSEEDFEATRVEFVRMTPLFAALGGISSRLASPRVRLLIERAEIPDIALVPYGSIMRALALWAIGGDAWTKALSQIPDAAVELYCGGIFLQGLARQSYIESAELSEEALENILEFVRRCADAQFDYKNATQRGMHLNKIREKMRLDRMNHHRKASL